jgi:hypothetical protein
MGPCSFSGIPMSKASRRRSTLSARSVAAHALRSMCGSMHSRTKPRSVLAGMASSSTEPPSQSLALASAAFVGRLGRFHALI